MSEERSGAPPGVVAYPFQGLFLDRPSWAMDPRAFEACQNVRIEQGRITFDLTDNNPFPNQAAGYPASTLGTIDADTGTIYLMYTMILSTGNPVLIYGTQTNLYAYRDGISQVITPSYNTGTITVVHDATTVAGVGTAWTSQLGGYGATTLTTKAVAGQDALQVAKLPRGAAVGQIITDATNVAAIPPGTLIKSINGTTITLSNLVDFDIPTSDTIKIGTGGPKWRNNVRAGDVICFGVSVPTQDPAPDSGSADSYHVIQSVDGAGSITLETEYTGGDLTNVPYFILQQFTAWTPTPNNPFGPWIPHWECDTFPQAGPPFNSDVLIATNGLDPIFAWNGLFGQTGAYRTEVPFTAGVVKRDGNLMLYGNLIGLGGEILPTSIANSDNGVPTTMAGGVAGQYVAFGGQGYVSHIGKLGGTTLIYISDIATGGGIVSAQFVGFPTNYSFSQLIGNRGPVTGRLVAEFPDRVQLLTQDGMIRYNGLFIQVMNDHIWRAVMNPSFSWNGLTGTFKGFDYTRKDWAYCAVHPGYGDLIWAVPLISDSSVANPVTGTATYSADGIDLTNLTIDGNLRTIASGVSWAGVTNSGSVPTNTLYEYVATFAGTLNTGNAGDSGITVTIGIADDNGSIQPPLTSAPSDPLTHTDYSLTGTQQNFSVTFTGNFTTGSTHVITPYFEYTGSHNIALEGTFTVVAQSAGSYPATQFAFVEHYMEQPNNYVFKPYTFRSWAVPACCLYPNTDNFNWSNFTQGWTTFTSPWNANQFLNFNASILFLGSGPNFSSSVLYVNNGGNQIGVQGCRFPLRAAQPSMRRTGLIKRIWPFETTGSPTQDDPISISVNIYDSYGANNANTFVETNTVQFPPESGYTGTSTNYAVVYRPGRVFNVQFDNFSQTSVSSPTWVLEGFQVDIAPGSWRGMLE